LLRSQIGSHRKLSHKMLCNPALTDSHPSGESIPE
jgi:hypothetical protein